MRNVRKLWEWYPMLGSALDGHNADDAPLNDESCDTLYKEINPFVRFFMW